MGTGVSRNTPIKSDSERPSKKTVGGWTEQDLENPQVLADARSLAVIVTNKIQAEPNLSFHFSKPIIDVTDIQSQVVNGTNYRIEYVVEDDEGDHKLFVTALMYRPLQAPITRSEIVKYDYALENVNRSDKKQPTTVLDRNQGMAMTTTQKRTQKRRRAR